MRHWKLRVDGGPQRVLQLREVIVELFNQDNLRPVFPRLSLGVLCFYFEILPVNRGENLLDRDTLLNRQFGGAKGVRMQLHSFSGELHEGIHFIGIASRRFGSLVR